MNSVSAKQKTRVLAVVGCVVLIISSAVVSGCTSPSDEETVQKTGSSDLSSLSPPANGVNLPGSVEESDFSESIYIHGAGIVLASPFLPVYFARLGLIQDGRFVSSTAAQRGAFLLRYLCYTGESPDFDCTLVKILCGIDPSESISQNYEVTDQERELSKNLLLGLIQNWRAIGSSSPEGLRESFLKREGKLERQDEFWTLTVETKTMDVLLDQLPWSYTSIRHSWMKSEIRVKWR